MTATVAVPTTDEGKVKNKVVEAIKKVQGPKNTMTKVIENPGQPVMTALMSKNIFKRMNCACEFCPLKWKDSECRDDCYKENITYQATCNLCINEQLNHGIDKKFIKESVYEGETSRSLFTRVKGHVDRHKKKAKNDSKKDSIDEVDVEQDDDRDNFMWKHMKRKHSETLANGPIDIREIFNF